MPRRPKTSRSRRRQTPDPNPTHAGPAHTAPGPAACRGQRCTTRTRPAGRGRSDPPPGRTAHPRAPRVVAVARGGDDAITPHPLRLGAPARAAPAPHRLRRAARSPATGRRPGPSGTGNAALPGSRTCSPLPPPDARRVSTHVGYAGAAPRGAGRRSLIRPPGGVTRSGPLSRSAARSAARGAPSPGGGRIRPAPVPAIPPPRRAPRRACAHSEQFRNRDGRRLPAR